MSYKLLEVEVSQHRELKNLSKEKKIPIKYLVKEALKAFLELQIEVEKTKLKENV